MITDTGSNTQYLREDGTPNLPLLISMFNRCSPQVQGGTQWMYDVRFCRWPRQFMDGRKHDIEGDPNGEALPWNNASDIRTFTVDDLINERKAMLVASFWRALAASSGAADDEAGGYAIALLEWLMFHKMFKHLLDEVDLSADYQEHLGWCLLAPRWRRELGLKRYTLKLSQIAEAANGAPPGSKFAEMVTVITDPSQEDRAVELLQEWYDWYVASMLPADLQGRVPKTTVKQARKAVVSMRSDGEATIALPYVCRNEPEIHALKPWDEAFIPPELTSENELVFQVERVTEAELRNRIITEDYDPNWVEEALKHKGAWASSTLPVGNPVGVNGSLSGGAAQPMGTGQTPGLVTDGAVEVIYAVFRAPDEDGIAAVYCCVFHRQVTSSKNAVDPTKDLYASFDVVESIGGEMPYASCMREKWCRSLVASRGIAELAHTQQSLEKSILDGIVDRQSITLLPPVNVYESPTGTKYNFGPAKQNYVRQGREPKFMEMPSGQGLADSTETHGMVRKQLDNRFANLSEDVPPARQQVFQEHGVRRFLASWTNAFIMALELYRQNGDDAEFAQVTGAPAGWLDGHRNQPGIFQMRLDFDVRELDSELMMKRIEAMNSIVLPNDVLGVINRGQWASEMTRAILGPGMSKRIVVPQPDASQALMNKARQEVLQMFAGNTPQFVDDKDPTAGGLLQLTKQIVMGNPVYMAALTDDALVAVAGQQAQMLAQQLGQSRQPNERFSGLLVKWLQNLQFVGVTQPKNKQIGRIGVDPAAGAA